MCPVFGNSVDRLPVPKVWRVAARLEHLDFVGHLEGTARGQSAGDRNRCHPGRASRRAERRSKNVICEAVPEYRASGDEELGKVWVFDFLKIFFFFTSSFFVWYQLLGDAILPSAGVFPILTHTSCAPTKALLLLPRVERRPRQRQRARLLLIMTMTKTWRRKMGIERLALAPPGKKQKAKKGFEKLGQKQLSLGQKLHVVKGDIAYSATDAVGAPHQWISLLLEDLLETRSPRLLDRDWRTTAGPTWPTMGSWPPGRPQ